MSYYTHTCAAAFQIKSCTSQGSLTGYASVFNELDDQGDRVLKGAFQKSLDTMKQQRQFPKMLWQHEASEPIGIWEEIIEDGRGLLVKGRLILELRRAQDAYALMKAGVLDSLSIGYRVVQAVRGQKGKERHLTQLDLFEISLVTFPANQSAKILNLKKKEKNDDALIDRIYQTIRLLKS